MAASKATGARKDKDRSYRHVFKGSVLVNTLLDYDVNRFSNRQAAVKFAQKLLDLGQVESIVGKRSFEDGVALYRWCDETVVREAKKIAHTTTTSHIPKRRLIELLDLQQDGTAEGYSVEKTKENFNIPAAKPTVKKTPPAATATTATTTTTVKKTPPAATTATTTTTVKKTPPAAAATTATATTRQSRATSSGPQPRRSRANANNNNSAAVKPRDGSTVVKPRDGSAVAKPRDGSTVAKPRDGSTVRTRSKAVVKPTTKAGVASASAHAPASHQRGTTASAVRATDSASRADNAETRHRATGVSAARITNSPEVRKRAENVATRRDSRARIDTPETRGDGAQDTNTTPPTTEAVELVRCPDSSIRPAAGTAARIEETVVGSVDTSIERHVDKVLDGHTGAALAVSDDYDGFDSDVFTSPVTSPTTPPQHPLAAKQADDSHTSGARYVTHDAEAVVSSSGDETSLTGVTGDLANLTAENSGFSDNEKQLLQQMRKMQEEHKTAVQEYEREIKELMSTISQLQASIEQQHGGAQTHGQPHHQSALPVTGTTASQETGAGTAPATACLIPEAPPPPGGPPPPPPPPVPGTNALLRAQKSLATPTKPQVVPRVKMRPLFWNRILLGQCYDDDEDEMTFWHTAEEPNFDLIEFEALFGRDPAKDITKKKSLHELITTKKDTSTKQQKVKLLDENRSRAVGIKLRSLHCDMRDIRNAVYKMEFTKLDVESIHGLYEIKGSEEELAKVTTYLDDHPGASLDQPEQFLLELSKMPQFSERLECLIFRKSFNETLFNIDQQLDTVQQACYTLKRSQPIHLLLQLILAFGNYMNGGTQRGQADAYDLDVISKLKDVKSIDNSTNLLRHIVNIQSLEEHDAGKDEATYKLPDSSAFTQAGSVSFRDVTTELSRLKTQLKAHSRKADIVCLNADIRDLQPFKDQMEDFFESAETMLKGQVEKMDSTRDLFQELLQFLTVKDPQASPESFFGMWAQFLDDYKNHWKIEQKHIAKNMFNSVQDRRKERMRRRRESVKEDGKSSTLKEKFSSRRRRSVVGDSQSLASNLFRSQSVCNVDSAGADDNADMTSCATEPRTRTRRRLQHTQSVDVTMSMMSLNDDAADHSASISVEKSMGAKRRERSNLMRSRSTAGVPKCEEISESMSERMKHRRRNKLSDDVSDVSPVHTPEPTPVRTPISRRTPAESRVSQSQLSSRIGSRLASESSASPNANESLKERMDRRRREREGTVSDSYAESPSRTGMSGRLSSAKSSIDLVSIRQKFSGSDSGAHNTVTSPPPVETRAQISRRASSSNLDTKGKSCRFNDKDYNCDHASCQANRLAKSSAISGSQDSLHTTRRADRTMAASDVSRKRRDNWRGSQPSLTDDAPRSRAKDSWRGSHSNLSDIGAVKTAISNLKPAKEREPISWRGASKTASGSESETAGRTAPASRQKQPKANLSRDPASWRGSQSNLSETASKRKESWRGSHQNLSSDLGDNSVRARKKEAWRGSQGNLASSVNTAADESLTRARRRDAWRSSQTNLTDNTEKSSPRMRRSSSRTSLSDTSTEPGRLRKTSSKTSVNESAQESTPRRRRDSTTKSATQNSGTDATKPSCVSSVMATDSKLSQKEEDALLERNYRERLRKLSRSKQNLVDGRR